MSEANIRELHTNYEILGDTPGPVIALTHGNGRSYAVICQKSPSLKAIGCNCTTTAI